MAYKCILAMIKPNLTDHVVTEAKCAGATGATIIPASGTGKEEAKTFFGLHLDVSTDIVVFVVREASADKVLEAIYEQGHFSEPGTGIAIVLPIEKVLGMESQMSGCDA